MYVTICLPDCLLLYLLRFIAVDNDLALLRVRFRLREQHMVAADDQFGKLSIT